MMTGAVGFVYTPEHEGEPSLANGDADLIHHGARSHPRRSLPGRFKLLETLKAGNMDWPVQYERGNIF